MFTHVRNNEKLLFFGVNPSDARIAVSPYDVYRRDLEIYGPFALRYTFHDADRFPIERFPEALEVAASGEAWCRSIRGDYAGSAFNQPI